MAWGLLHPTNNLRAHGSVPYPPRKIRRTSGLLIRVGASPSIARRPLLLETEVARKFLAELLAHGQVRALLSDDHFSVDGTQVQAWASMKSFVAKDGSGEPPSPGRNGERDFHGEQRSNETHASSTDAEAKLS